MKNEKNYLSYLFSLVFCLFTFSVFAQNGTIRGKVIDTNINEPLIGAVVIVEGTSFGAAVDFDGNFIIQNIPAGNYTLTASYMAYQPIKNTVTVADGQISEINFLMVSEAIALNTVVVVGRANREVENVLLGEQRNALVATQAVGSRELSRK